MNWVKWNQVRYGFYAPFYDLFLMVLNKKRAKCFSSITFKEGSSVALLGCGTGLDLEHLPLSSKVYASDLSLQMLQKAHSRGIKTGFNHYSSICMNAEFITLKNDSQDYVILSLILAVVNNPLRCMQEAVRILKPGGTMMILDKFIPMGTKGSLLRRSINPLAKFIATDLTRSLEPILDGLPLSVVEDQSVFKVFRFVKLKKK